MSYSVFYKQSSAFSLNGLSSYRQEKNDSEELLKAKRMVEKSRKGREIPLWPGISWCGLS
jgi:hypothetical protein